MNALFQYIKAYIIANVSDFATSTSVRMWNDQFNESNDKGKRTEKAFAYPACFIEFIFEQADNRCLGIIDYILIVRFHLGIENMLYERYSVSFPFVDRFCTAMQLLAPSKASGLIFTTFQEVARGTFEAPFDNVEVLTVDYRTRFRYTAPFVVLPTMKITSLEIDVDIEEELPEDLLSDDSEQLLTDTGQQLIG